MSVVTAVRHKLSALRAMNPSAAAANYQRGNLLADRQDWQGAIDCYQQAIAHHHTQLSRVYYCLGNALSKLCRLEDAIAAYRKSIAIEPDYYWAYHDLARVALQSCQWDVVITTCHQAIPLAPDNFWIHYYLGQALIAQQHWELAIPALERAIAIDPDYHWTYKYLATAYRARGDLDRAIEIWQQGIAHNPNQGELHRGFGDALTDLDRLPEAICAYQTASRLLLSQSHPHIELLPPTNANPIDLNFLIVGAIKGGTTSLYAYLTQHPQILPAICKEIHFWDDRDGNFARGLDWYRAHLPIVSPSAGITGEATATCLADPHASSRLAGIFPDTKIIALLRNPIDRAISHYHMFVKEGKEQRSLEVAFQAELDFLTTQQESDWHNAKMPGYLHDGIYVRQLQRWWQSFSQSQFMTIESEDLFANPAAIVDRVFAFLGVAPHQLTNYPIENPGDYAGVSDSIRQQLHQFFLPYNQELATCLARKFDWDLKV
jgi:tetratricopeptide (TPR) repeat protein